jgi:hypothetical protein
LAPVVEGTRDAYGMLWFLVEERVCALGRPSVLALPLTTAFLMVALPRVQTLRKKAATRPFCGH